ncbi:PIN domain-containing protein [Sphingomonas bacterium]|uniref:PIN domain-containing protein n=1 Tax=Sphingomonas bacterium TaxID=1895847 RepID=UPI001577279D|nr:PIN domain-containing protein [Sphingomonas bacterium]
MSGVFVDSNILIYSIDREDHRRIRAQAIMVDGPTISVQCLNEFAAVARRKLRLSWSSVQASLDEFRQVCPRIVSVTLNTHQLGITFAERHRLSIYDALIVAAAFHAGCDILYSEDMHHGLVIDGRLRIENPFAQTAR